MIQIWILFGVGSVLPNWLCWIQFQTRQRYHLFKDLHLGTEDERVLLGMRELGEKRPQIGRSAVDLKEPAPGPSFHGALM